MAPRHNFWDLCPALWAWQMDLPLVLSLAEWAERNHPEAFNHLFGKPTKEEIRKTLGGIGRRMRREAPEAFSDAIAADDTTWTILRPYIERLPAPPENEWMDRYFRGVRDKADAIALDACENWERYCIQSEGAVDGVPPGWSRTGWQARLRQLASACQPLHPDRAAELRAEAEKLDLHSEKSGA